jgi:hypothetical protein
MPLPFLMGCRRERYFKASMRAKRLLLECRPLPSRANSISRSYAQVTGAPKRETHAWDYELTSDGPTGYHPG